jgi:hypothetical protein
MCMSVSAPAHRASRNRGRGWFHDPAFIIVYISHFDLRQGLNSTVLALRYAICQESACSSWNDAAASNPTAGWTVLAGDSKKWNPASYA